MLVKLLKISLENFKGITIEIENPKNIYADNRVGKTTIADAFLWLFDGKSLDNKQNFEVKPLDKFNNIIHNKNVL